MPERSLDTQAKFLNRVVRAVTESRTLGEVLIAGINTICRYTGWPTGHAFIVSHDAAGTEYLVSSSVWHGASSPALEAFRKATERATFRLGEGVVGEVWQSRAATAIRDVREEPRFLRLDGIDGMAGCFAFPLLAGDHVVAVFEFFSKAPIRMDGDVLDAIETAAALLGHAIEREAAEEVAQERDFLTAAIEHAGDGVAVYRVVQDRVQPFVACYVNDTFVRQSGYSREEIIGQPPSQLFGPDTDQQIVSDARDQLFAGHPVRLELCKYRKDATQFWVEVNIRPMPGPDGRPQYITSIQRDITERKRAESALAAAQAQLQLLSTAVDRANDIIVMYERTERDEWQITYVNDAFTRATGYSAAEAIGQTSRLLEGPQTDLPLLNSLRKKLLEGEDCRAEIAFCRKDGGTCWVELNARPLASPEGKIRNTIVLYRDITESRMRREALSHEAAHDPLTGLYNRRFLDRALEEGLRTVEDGGIGHCLLYLDLDGFKRVNDQYGHEAGDRLLAELSLCLCGHLREADIIARVGGDEFAVLLQRCSPGQGEHVAQQLIDAVRGYRLNWEGTSVAVGVSIGVATLDASVSSAKAALRRADEACYTAKKAGRNRIAMPQIPAYHS